MALPRILLVALSVLLPFTGCQDPTGPCDRPNACEVTGVDLYIDRIEFVTTQYDSIDGLGVVRSDTVEIESVVRNRGDTISASTMMVLRYAWADEDTILIPSLRPGEAHTERTRLAAWFTGLFAWKGVVGGDTATVTAELLIADSDSSNNQAVSAVVHMAMPVIEFTLALADTDIWVGEPVGATLTISNRSRHGQLGPRAIGFFLKTPPPARDVAGGTTFGTRDVPALPPSSQYVEDFVLTIPSRAGWQGVARDYVIHTTMAVPGTGDVSAPWLSVLILEGVAGITLHPDYRACQPALLAPDTLIWAPFVCDVPHPIYVFELEARTDRVYSIEQPDPYNPGATIYMDDGTEWGDVFPGMQFQFAEAGTYWVVDWLGRRYDIPPARSMRLRQQFNASSED